MKNCALIIIPIFVFLLNSPSLNSKESKKNETSKSREKIIKAESLKRELSQKEKLIAKLKSKETSIISLIEDLEDKIKRDDFELRRLNDHRKALNPEIFKLEADVFALEKELKIKRGTSG